MKSNQWCAVMVLWLATSLGQAAEPDADGFLDLIASEPWTQPWKTPIGEWKEVGTVKLNPDNPKLLVGDEGKGILLNGPKGKTRNLVTKEKYGDLEVKFDFLVSKKSNSGIKFHEVYEVQIHDSHGIKNILAKHCGGIYPRAELKPKYHHIDKGIPPKTNATKPAGEWQTMHIIFRAPRFEGDKKVKNAKLEKVVLNGKVLHDNVELKYPTGHNWTKKEHATGRLFFQADHGPVAFRNLKIKPLGDAPKSTDKSAD